MIKFNCLIHKETSTVIKYDEWLKHLKGNEDIMFTKISYKPYIEKTWGTYKPQNMLLSSEFEIIYESEFTLSELNGIVGFVQSKEIVDKLISEIIKKREIHKKYRIEV